MRILKILVGSWCLIFSPSYGYSQKNPRSGFDNKTSSKYIPETNKSSGFTFLTQVHQSFVVKVTQITAYVFDAKLRCKILV